MNFWPGRMAIAFFSAMVTLYQKRSALPIGFLKGHLAEGQRKGLTK
jgi:hypothetical protein